MRARIRLIDASPSSCGSCPAAGIEIILPLECRLSSRTHRTSAHFRCIPSSATQVRVHAKRAVRSRRMRACDGRSCSNRLTVPSSSSSSPRPSPREYKSTRVERDHCIVFPRTPGTFLLATFAPPLHDSPLRALRLRVFSSPLTVAVVRSTLPPIAQGEKHRCFARNRVHRVERAMRNRKMRRAASSLHGH